MRTVPRNIPMKFHRSNMKTEGEVCIKLKLHAEAPDADGLYIYITKYPTSFVGGYKKYLLVIAYIYSSDHKSHKDDYIMYKSFW